MGDKIIILVVVTVAVSAHVWLFLWIKFKIEEGAIIKFLKDSQNKECGSVDRISSFTAIPAARVTRICIKSKIIKNHVMDKNLWVVN